jgi:hypothetical protein
MARVRTTKELAQRIELDYFQRPHPFRRWMRLLSVGAMVMAAGWLIVEAIPGDQSVYTPGPVSQAHALFGSQCIQCHGPADGGIYWRDVSDTACLKCHDGPIHHENQLRFIGTHQGQMVASNCASCHVEHKGQTRLARMSNRHCTQCHADLQTKGPAAHSSFCIVAGHRVERKITRFTSSEHPEVAVLRTGQKDVAQIKLNHEVHLKPNLKGPEGPVQMTCTDCHELDDKGAYMAPIQYEKHCMVCHLLDYDPRREIAPRNTPDVRQALQQETFAEYVAQHPDRFPVVPHETPEEVRAFLQWTYSREKVGDSADFNLPLLFASPQARLLSRLRYAQLPKSVRTSTDQLVQAAEVRLYRTKKRGCLECHSVAFSGQPSAVSGTDSDASSLPSITPTVIPNRWLPHSVFDHKAHRLLACVACHAQAPQSRDTADVLLPGIKACVECHRESGGARSSCVECHLYHDRSRERRRGGQFTIEQLRTGVVLTQPR